MEKQEFDEFRENLQERFDYYEDDVQNDDLVDFHEILEGKIEEVKAFKLYRYMPISFYSLRNIETQKLHLSENGLMNDVFEGLPIAEEYISADDAHELHDLAVMSCLTESNDNLLMWSHYADSNRGICIEYDLKLLMETQYSKHLSYLYPVLYGNRRYVAKDYLELIQNTKELREGIKESIIVDTYDYYNVLPLFLTKSLDWSYEREWRIVYTKKDLYDLNDQELYSSNIYFPCVNAVYLGYRIEPEVRRSIEEACERLSRREKREIKVYQVGLERDCYRLNFTQL